MLHHPHQLTHISMYRQKYPGIMGIFLKLRLSWSWIQYSFLQSIQNCNWLPHLMSHKVRSVCYFCALVSLFHRCAIAVVGGQYRRVLLIKTTYKTSRYWKCGNVSDSTSWSSDMTVRIGIPLVEPGLIASICLECRTNIYAANQCSIAASCPEEAMESWQLKKQQKSAQI